MLDVAHLNSGYGVVPILRDVGLSAQGGEISLVVGENGAGKSTLLRTIAGFIRPQSGSVKFDGAEVSGLRPEAIAMRGARLVLDGHRIFPGLSVWDNMRLGATIRRDRATFDAAVEEAFAIFPILAERLRHPAGSLSGGQQQMLALAQAFVGEPKLLMCDEPSLGLAQNLMPPIFQALRAWAARGMAVIVVEQYVEAVLPYADKVIVLDRGRLTAACAACDYVSNRSEEKEEG
jgi:branched-chain amino acid transport system ATP-binding protein